MNRDELMVMFEQPWWEQRYDAAEDVWSGKPNVTLVEQVCDIPPGRALEIGCGEGGDTVWLAGRGWQVTAVDFAAAGLERSARYAAAHGVAGNVTFHQEDVRVWQPPTAAFDLVTCHFLHLPAGAALDLFARLGAAVAPGGTLLVVGHHVTDLETTVRRPALPDMFYTAEDVAGVLDPARWEIRTADKRPADVTDQDGNPATIHFAVLRARRT